MSDQDPKKKVDQAKEETKPEASDTLDRENYDVPDGQVITVGAERFRVPEVVYKPDLIGLQPDE